MGFFEILNKFKWVENKLWVVQGRECYNKLLQKCLDDNGILMYST